MEFELFSFLESIQDFKLTLAVPRVSMKLFTATASGRKLDLYEFNNFSL